MANKRRQQTINKRNRERAVEEKRTLKRLAKQEKREALRNGETPELETPGLETPGLETTELETPELETPGLERPEVETPQLETPVDEQQ